MSAALRRTRRRRAHTCRPRTAGERAAQSNCARAFGCVSRRRRAPTGVPHACRFQPQRRVAWLTSLYRDGEGSRRVQSVLPLPTYQRRYVTLCRRGCATQLLCQPPLERAACVVFARSDHLRSFFGRVVPSHGCGRDCEPRVMTTQDAAGRGLHRRVESLRASASVSRAGGGTNDHKRRCSAFTVRAHKT